jgi:urea transport system permease protein
MNTGLSVLRHAWAALLLLAVAAPWIVSPYELSLLGRFLALAILALGLVLIWGEAGILTLGQGVFFGLGGYVLAMHLKLAGLPAGELPDFMTWSGRSELPWWWQPFTHAPVALAAIVVVPGAAAALFAWAVFRRRVVGVYFALITQALALCFATLLVSQQETTGGFNGLTDFSILLGFDLAAKGSVWTLYWVTVALVTLSYLGLRWLIRSRFGTLLRATRDGENRVRFLGHNPTPYKVVAFSISAVLAGISGALFTLHAGVMSPALVGVVPSIEMVIWVAVGGRSSLWGAIAGALLVNFAKDEISSTLPDAWLYVLGLVFVLVVTLMPRGLAGFAGDVRRRLLAGASRVKKTAVSSAAGAP